MEQNQFQPIDVTDLDLTFGGKIEQLLPEYNKIPDDFKERNNWTDIIDTWFFQGLPKETEIIPKEGIDPSKALRHVQAIMRSFRPKHEHKTAGCAWLLSLWFDKFIVPENKPA